MASPLGLTPAYEGMKANTLRAFVDHKLKHDVHLIFPIGQRPLLNPQEEIFFSQGKRSKLEDRHFFSKTDKYCLWGIFDGHGDEGKIGELCSEMIPKQLPELVTQYPGDMPRAFSEMLKSVQEEVRKRKMPEAKDGGSTAHINYLNLKTNELFVATLGDSKTKLGFVSEKKRKLLPLSPICNWGTPEEEERAYRFAGDEMEKYREIWDLQLGKHRRFPPLSGCNVSRALGHLGACNEKNESPFSIEPMVSLWVLNPGDVVLSGSDGLWDYLYMDVTEMILESDLNTPMPLASSLGKYCLLKSKDNVTVIAVKV